LWCFTAKGLLISAAEGFLLSESLIQEQAEQQQRQNENQQQDDPSHTSSFSYFCAKVKKKIESAFYDMPEELVSIGRTRKTHGVQGELKFAIEDRYWEVFEGLHAVFLPIKDVPTPFFIESMRGSFPEVIVKLEGLNTPEAARMLSHKEVFARAKDLPSELLGPEPETELSYAFLEGFEASDLHAGALGKITEVQQWPQQEMAVLEREGRELLIPLHRAFIRAIDHDKRQVTFDLPEGLLDL
jgi:16S rRNA processing protein RimM